MRFTILGVYVFCMSVALALTLNPGRTSMAKMPNDDDNFSTINGDKSTVIDRVKRAYSPDGASCKKSSACASLVCSYGICQPPTCQDGVKNQDETDVDCGGYHCGPCGNKKACCYGWECISKVCTGGICRAPTCKDGVMNQDETSIDCGGTHCKPCANGQNCTNATDCISGQCGSNVCQACSLDVFINGGFETGTFQGWTRGGGDRNGIYSSNITSETYLPGGARYDANITDTHSAIVIPGNDPTVGALMPNIVYSGNYSCRVEDTTFGGYLSVFTQQINKYFCLDIYFAWLALLEDGGHAADESAFMLIELKDVTVGDIVLKRLYNAGVGGNGTDSRFKSLYVDSYTTYYYTPNWQIEHVTIDASRIGHDFALNVLAADCYFSGHRGYIYMDGFGGKPPV